LEAEAPRELLPRPPEFEFVSDLPLLPERALECELPEAPPLCEPL
jgi:hypothetical protein